MTASVPAPRRGRDHRLNLASNELIHPAVSALHQKMLADFDADDWRAYPVVADAAAAIASLFNVPQDAFTMTPGSDAAIRLLLDTVGEPFGHRLIVQVPNYDAWWTARNAACWHISKVESADHTADGSLRALTEAVNSAPPSVVAISWPNGPVGYTPPLADIEAFAAACAARGHLLVLDACYAGFTIDPRRLMPLASDRCVVLLSWSKLFGLAGTRLAVAFTGIERGLELRSWGRERELPASGLHLLSRTADVYDDFAGIWHDIAAQRDEWCAEIGDVLPSGGNFFCIPTSSAAHAAAVVSMISDTGYRVRDLGAVHGMPPVVRISVACGPIGEHFRPILLRALALAQSASNT